MKTIARAVVAISVLALISLGAGCKGGSGGKCEKAMDNLFTLMSDATGKLGGEQADKIKKEMESKKAETVKECKTRLEENPEKMGKALDCLASAEKMQDLQKCGEGMSGLMQ